MGEAKRIATAHRLRVLDGGLMPQRKPKSIRQVQLTVFVDPELALELDQVHALVPQYRNRSEFLASALAYVLGVMKAEIVAEEARLHAAQPTVTVDPAGPAVAEEALI